jgi:hypothetical protein
MWFSNASGREFTHFTAEIIFISSDTSCSPVGSRNVGRHKNNPDYKEIIGITELYSSNQ